MLATELSQLTPCILKDVEYAAIYTWQGDGAQSPPYGLYLSPLIVFIECYSTYGYIL